MIKIQRLAGCVKHASLLLITLLLFSCSEKPEHEQGRQLAEFHCASCHLFPEPSILPRRTWGENIIPNMGLKMGMSRGPLYSYGDAKTTKNLNPIMPQEDWDKIVHYYLNTSENKVSMDTIPNQVASAIFEAYPYTYDSIPLVSMISFDSDNGTLLLGDAHRNLLLTVETSGNIIHTQLLESPPVKVQNKDSLSYVLTIGNLNPSDEAKGKLSFGNKVIDSLIRPVDFLINDINSDGFEDIFVCNYGNTIGDFSLYQNVNNEDYVKKIIHPISGAIKVEMANMDADADNEIIVLFAQEHETIMIWDYENANFKGKNVAQFQPAFGAVDFQLVDMDSDGDKDIIIGNGDNSDFSTVLKNFHGVRILLNLGNKEFKEEYFFPMHGLSKLKVVDFDLDGDMDIIGISNFGNFSDPKFKSVQLLINQGSMNFKPYFIENLPDFRWQTIDISDYDNDGDPDVFIGSFDMNIGPKESDVSNRKKIAWVRLENRTN